MITFLRRNTIALIALVVALSGTSAYAINTIRSQDIVDGQVKTADLANGAVTAAKTSGMYAITRITNEQTSNCYAGPGQWRVCAPVSLQLPVGGNYTVTVTSTVQVDPGNSTVTAQFCPSLPGPSCIEGNPKWSTFLPRAVTSSTWSADWMVAGGLRTFSTGVRFSGPTLTDAYTQTRVDVYNSSVEEAK